MDTGTAELDSSLSLAAFSADVDAVHRLLRERRCVDEAGRPDGRALHSVVLGGPPVFRTVTMQFADDGRLSVTEDEIDKDPARDQRATIVGLLLDFGADIEHTVAGCTPLLSAVERGHPELCKILIERGARLDVRDQEGWCPLALAIRRGLTAIARLLVTHGASANVTANRGGPVLALAIEKGLTEAVKLLAAHGAPVNAPDDEDWLPLQSAACYGLEEAVDVLLAAGADPRGAGAWGRTALHEAARQGRFTIMARLIEAGADVDARDKGGRSPAFLAVFGKHDGCAVYLLDHGATVAATDNRGFTLLHLATLEGRTAVVKRLLDLGADPFLESAAGFTAFDGARNGHHEDIEAMLRARDATGTLAAHDFVRKLIERGTEAAAGRRFWRDIRYFNRALEQHPRDVQALSRKADALFDLGRHKEAVANYDAALAIDPGTARGQLWGNKGVSLHAMGRVDEAVACYEQVRAINPEDATACFNIGAIRQEQGRNEEAIRWFREALEHDPQHKRSAARLNEIQSGRNA